MAGFSNVGALVDAQVTDGQTSTASFIKTITTAVTTSAFGLDLSTYAGNPYINFYAAGPLEAARLIGTRGIYHGPDVSPKTKHVASMLLQVSSAFTSATSGFKFLLCDYLLYYPFVDLASLDPQVMDNTVALPRYADGAGVRAIFVAQSTTAGTGQYYVTYTNSDGVSGRTTDLLTFNPYTSSGWLLNGPAATARNFGPFMPLQAGDKGIRSIDSIQLISANSGVGCIVLVRPIAEVIVYEPGAPREVVYFKDLSSAPRIYDGAYLNLLVHLSQWSSAVTGPIIGTLTTVWN